MPDYYNHQEPTRNLSIRFHPSLLVTVLLVAPRQALVWVKEHQLHVFLVY